MEHTKEEGAELVLLISALTSILAVATICIFLLTNGVPAVGRVGIFRFPADEIWKPGNNIYGIPPMTLGSICVMAGAILVGVPIGILTAVLMARFYPERLYKIMKLAINLLAGIPSVVYGFFKLVVIMPVVSDSSGGNGKSIAMVSVLLEAVILPTIISVSGSAINMIPDNYYEGVLVLGANHERSVFFATLPAARSGILVGVVPGIGRAIGEAIAVIMATGNQPRTSKGISQDVRALTASIVMEMEYMTDLHREALIAAAVVLFVFTLSINLSFSVLNRRTE